MRRTTIVKTILASPPSRFIPRTFVRLVPNRFQYLTGRLAAFVQAYTLYSSVRPFGISTIIGGIDTDGPSLYVVEPSGVFFVSPYPIRCIIRSPPVKGYHGAAIGKGRQLAKTELEKLKLAELSTREAVIEAARMCDPVRFFLLIF